MCARAQQSKSGIATPVSPPGRLEPLPKTWGGHAGCYQGWPVAWTCCGQTGYHDVCSAEAIEAFRCNKVNAATMRQDPLMRGYLTGKDSGGYSPDSLSYSRNAKAMAARSSVLDSAATFTRTGLGAAEMRGSQNQLWMEPALMEGSRDQSQFHRRITNCLLYTSPSPRDS